MLYNIYILVTKINIMMLVNYKHTKHSAIIYENGTILFNRFETNFLNFYNLYSIICFSFF